ncbi:PEP-CTERM sorting domain-containing protein [Accumulibacter sp.]|uniref:PEP-CTERM sorting domain-containing protein n=1 Tax=Accumulibacter sp. TaxID=2053492 RepID=UPI0028C4BB4C|nr:PEP-CTERM sorting domain-containing protein [Accumulibacter sp.]
MSQSSFSMRAFRRVTVTVLALLAAMSTTAAPLVLSNASTSVTVYGGEANNGLVPSGGFFDYTDLSLPATPTWSIDPFLRFATGSTTVLSNGAAGGFGSPVALGGGTIGNSAVTGSVTTSAVTELIGTVARTTFNFTAATGTSLDGTTFGFYAENDILGFGDDTAAFTGSIAGGDLALFQYDTVGGGITVRLSGSSISGASLVSFGSGIWTGFGTALEGGDLTVLSGDGSNFVGGPGDLGLALAFALTGDSASIVIDYTTQPLPPERVPEPASVALVGVALLALATRRRKYG